MSDQEPMEVIVCWKRVYLWTDDTAKTPEEAVENAKQAMIDDGVMTYDDMQYLRSIRTGGYWEVLVGDTVIESSYIDRRKSKA